jgi:hypothetical protein
MNTIILLLLEAIFGFVLGTLGVSIFSVEYWVLQLLVAGFAILGYLYAVSYQMPKVQDNNKNRTKTKSVIG